MIDIALKAWRERPLSIAAPMGLGATHVLLGVSAPVFFLNFVEKSSLATVLAQGLPIFVSGAVAAGIAGAAFRYADSLSGEHKQGLRNCARAAGGGFLGASAWLLLQGLSGGLHVIGTIAT